jgi:hypothetical protein
MYKNVPNRYKENKMLTGIIANRLGMGNFVLYLGGAIFAILALMIISVKIYEKWCVK